MYTVRARPDAISMIYSYISLIISLAIIGLGIYLFIRIIKATKDIGKMKEDMEKIVEILDKKD
ncbi:hypothetical protein [Tissierella praeacuta]|uniref:hypothetical protein n=1 Tax=Tissierella praeacuta TaxID=43131 RepID=UPI00333F2644